MIFAITFLLFGALQLLPGFRYRRPDWNRKSGPYTALAGMIAAASSVWMALMHPEISTQPLFYARLVFGSLWGVFIILGVRFVLLRQIPKHRAFMIRAYAIAANAGTLPFVYFPIYAIYGEMSPLIDDSIQIIGWLINLTVAEWIIRRKPGRRASRALKPKTM